jgi:hypothetical protein
VRMAKEYSKKELLQWFCGFYEGEGSVSNDVGNNNRLRLSISQNDITPLEIAKKFWGGAIVKRTRKSPASDKICVGHEWRLPHKQALEFISDIKPYMIIPQKIAQIDRVLKIFNTADKLYYKCSACEKEYANPSARRRHYKNTHQDTDASTEVNNLVQEDQIAGTS